MRYFKGSRRSVTKKSSHSLKDDSSASKTAADSSVSGQAQRKRPHTVDTAETGQTKRSKRSKQSSSRRKTCLAASGYDRATDKKDTKTTSDDDQPAVIKRKKQVIPTGSLSSSESDKSLNLSDQSDSLHATACDTGELGEQSDRKFLQQQIKILKTPFQLEDDCPALSRIKANDSNHIPLQVIHNTLRKVNHKTEDDILRSLNRLSQRKLLESLSVRPESSITAAISDEQLKRYKEVQTRVANLENAHHEMIQEHAQCECIGVLVSQMEAISKEFNKKDLMHEVQKTNDFLANSSPPTTSETQNMSNINAGARPRVDASGYIPSTHEQLVQILFKD